jgi:hypothetical protein
MNAFGQVYRTDTEEVGGSNWKTERKNRTWANIGDNTVECLYAGHKLFDPRSSAVRLRTHFGLREILYVYSGLHWWNNGKGIEIYLMSNQGSGSDQQRDILKVCMFIKHNKWIIFTSECDWLDRLSIESLPWCLSCPAKSIPSWEVGSHQLAHSAHQ